MTAQDSTPARTAGSTAGSGAPRRGSASTARKPFRPEIQGLRALAVTLVAAYHIWFGRVSGGVDVFLFISAFLMTGSFTRRIERGEAIGFRAVTTYWVHTFKRILPLAVVTVVLILLGVRMLFESERWMPMIHEAVSVMFYYENWYSIFHQIDYYSTEGVSPFRHFWSLSLQGQIFILWPLLFALAWFLTRRLKKNPRVVLATVFGTVFLASLAFSVYYTHANQTAAYYSTFTRLWEFALGSLAAIVAPWIRIPGPVRGVLNWVGTIAVLVCGAVLDVNGTFPGWVALWPTLAASMILVGGQSGTRWGGDRLLSWGPLVKLGKYSYGLYLLHWPLDVFYLNETGTEHAGLVSGFGIIAMALLGSVLLTELVETPLRAWKWPEARRWRALVVVLCCLLVGAGGAWGWQARIDRVTETALAQADKNNPGAKSLEPGFTYQGKKDPTIIPTARDRADDWARLRGLGTTCDKEQDMSPALQGEACYHVVKNDHPRKKVIAVGNSHTEEWMTAMQHTARDNDWDLTFLRHPGCFYTTVDDNSFLPACQDWYRAADAYLTAHQPDSLMLQSTFSTYDGSAEQIRPGTEEQVKKWTSKGVTVVGVRDNPRWNHSMSACEQDNGWQACTFDHVMAHQGDPTKDWENSIPGYGAVDMVDLVCPHGACPAVIGNVYTYIDDNHLTGTYVESMTDQYTQRYEAAMTTAEQRLGG